MPFMNFLPEDATQLHLFEKYPESSKLILEFTEVLLRGPSPFTVAERELIGAFTSNLNGCQFCFGVHAAAAEHFGVDPALLESLLEDIETAAIDDKLKPILRYVRKLTLDPTRMTQADADAILDAGWDEDAFHHVVSVCALFNYYNRVINGHGIKGSPVYLEECGKRLASSGYASIMDMLKNTMDR
ncbi:MAG: carboxymuconolactone decarboxylase family protein [Sphingomonadales bacterium]